MGTGMAAGALLAGVMFPLAGGFGYASNRAARELSVRSYVGIPIYNPDDTLFGTLCGIDRDKEMDPHHRGQPQAEPYRVATTTHHEGCPGLPTERHSPSDTPRTTAMSPSYQLYVGVDIAVRTIQAVRPHCDGVHIMAIKGTHRLADIITKARLG